MQHDGTLENYSFRGPLYIHKRHPDNNYLIMITNMDHDQRTSIKTNIHPKTQFVIRLKFIALVQN